MDGLTLLDRAQKAGLAVRAEGGKLVVRGPKRAEPVVRLLAAHKGEIITALADEARDWQTRHKEAIQHWATPHDKGEAARLAWSEMENRWHRLHGVLVPASRCAGCGSGIAGTIPIFDMGDGNQVHFDSLDCLIRYGQRWRGAATRALVAMGLQPPASDDDR
jgi:hypothetical protein